jgi:hypothetical protein
MLLIKRENNRSILRFFVFIAILLFIFLICVSSANSTNIKIDSVNLIEENTTIYLFDDHIEGVSNFTLINKENKTVNKSFFYRPGYFIVEGKVICNSKVLFNIMWVNSETTPICQSLDKSLYFYILQS